MKLAEVDALMAGHPRKEEPSDPRIRPGMLLVSYDEKPGAIKEGDHVLDVYFDKDGRLVSKGIEMYIR